MAGRGRRADDQFVRDLLVGQALGDQQHDLVLPRGQWRGGPVVGALLVARSSGRGQSRRVGPGRFPADPGSRQCCYPRCDPSAYLAAVSTVISRPSANTAAAADAPSWSRANSRTCSILGPIPAAWPRDSRSWQAAPASLAACSGCCLAAARAANASSPRATPRRCPHIWFSRKASARLSRGAGRRSPFGDRDPPYSGLAAGYLGPGVELTEGPRRPRSTGPPSCRRRAPAQAYPSRTPPGRRPSGCCHFVPREPPHRRAGPTSACPAGPLRRPWPRARPASQSLPERLRRRQGLVDVGDDLAQRRAARAAAWAITRSAVGTVKSSPLARLSSRLSCALRSSTSYSCSSNAISARQASARPRTRGDASPASWTRNRSSQVAASRASPSAAPTCCAARHTAAGPPPHDREPARWPGRCRRLDSAMPRRKTARRTGQGGSPRLNIPRAVSSTSARMQSRCRSERLDCSPAAVSRSAAYSLIVSSSRYLAFRQGRLAV